MADSNLVTLDMPAYIGNYTQNRAKNGGAIKMITIHHTGGITTAQAVGKGWQKAGRNASSHYGVGDNIVAQYVPENAIAWTNSNWNANKNAVTIEVCNSKGAPNWEVSEVSLQTAIKLVADIAKRNGIYPLVVGQNLTYHSMYVATTCPGPYLLSMMSYIAQQANVMINNGQLNSSITVTADTVLFAGKSANLNGNRLNVRTGAGTNYPLLSGYPQLNEGNQFDVLAQTGNWYKIRIAGKYIGFVSTAYVTQDNLHQAPTQGAFPFSAYAHNLGTAHLNVRTGAGTNYSSLQEYPVLAQGNQFDVLAESGNWYQIRIAGKYVGWVSKSYVARQ